LSSVDFVDARQQILLAIASAMVTLVIAIIFFTYN